jgi:hypothetical protein
MMMALNPDGLEPLFLLPLPLEPPMVSAGGHEGVHKILDSDEILSADNTVNLQHIVINYASKERHTKRAQKYHRQNKEQVQKNKKRKGEKERYYKREQERNVQHEIKLFCA